LNLFKPLRRHFQANTLCRWALLRRNAGGRSAAARETDDQLFQPGLCRARRELRLDRSLQSAAGGTASTEPDTRPFLSRLENKYGTTDRACQAIVLLRDL
jgi:hypothetical protein